MQGNGRSRWLTIGLTVAAVTACAGSQTSSTMSTSGSPAGSTATSGGDVASNRGGMWIDSAAGTWMDTAGAVWSRSGGGSALALRPSDVMGFTNANIAAHLTLGDSIEIALSNGGTSRAEHADVRNFATRMVKEHSQHMQMAAQMISQAGLTPMPAPSDTADMAMAMGVISQLAGSHSGADYDKKFMRAEVMLHQHMLHDLTLLRAQASGPTLQVIDQTIPVVQKHLRDAQTVLYVALDDKAGSKRGAALKPPPR